MRIAVTVLGREVLAVHLGAPREPRPEAPPRPPWPPHPPAPLDLDAVHVVLPDHGGPDVALCGEPVGHLPSVPRPRALCPVCEAEWVRIRAGEAS